MRKAETRNDAPRLEGAAEPTLWLWLGWALGDAPALLVGRARFEDLGQGRRMLVVLGFVLAYWAACRADETWHLLQSAGQYQLPGAAWAQLASEILLAPLVALVIARAVFFRVRRTAWLELASLAAFVGAASCFSLLLGGLTMLWPHTLPLPIDHEQFGWGVALIWALRLRWRVGPEAVSLTTGVPRRSRRTSWAAGLVASVVLSCGIELGLASSPRLLLSQEPNALASTEGQGPQMPRLRLDYVDATGAVAKPLLDPKAKFMLLNFWATWCGSCIEEFPALRRVADAYAVHGLRVNAVHVRSSRAARAALPAWVAEHNPGLSVFVDDGRAAEALGVSMIPYSCIVYPNGQVASCWAGALDYADLVERVEQARPRESM